MTKIYLVRHCEAEGNLKQLFQGRIDTDVTTLGAKQLEFLTERFKDVKLDAIYSSPLKRAFKTAEAVKGEREMPINIHKGLTEIDGGVVDGKPFKETFIELGILDDWINRPWTVKFEEGESFAEVYDRASKALFEIVEKHKGQTIAIASHGGVIRVLSCKALYDDLTKLKDVNWFENTSVTVLEFDDDMKPSVSLFNDFSHLPKEFLNDKSRISNFMEKKE